ncbi:hypothetical protein [Porphyrobacter sp. YT40]|uniref:hypothetical protein n=1 Tax=Porphyrobacter sp. YT40 TaxID=2547601 RepID=UPI0011446DA4|nr:hypothetical protein [Porphyrobacter sp. YT40]QDH33544.1 hypothetical protein E2E27_03830 [Porphyrobacter sp. YT40]
MIAARLALIAGLGLGLAACAGSGGSAPARAPAAAAPPRSTIMVVPQVMAPQGLGGVIGSPPAALLRRFGAPRLDVAEGDARKLQFAGRACVLDIYLYPLAAAAEPTATHVEARLRQGGAPVDPAACIREVEGR